MAEPGLGQRLHRTDAPSTTGDVLAAGARLPAEELRRILRSVPDFVWSAELTPGGTWNYRYCSPVVESLTGYPREYLEADPQRWMELIHPQDLASIHSGMHQAILGGEERIEEEYRIVRRDGAERWVRDSILFQRLPDGTVVLDGVVSDITARKAAESALYQAHAALDQRVRERTAELAASEERFRQLAENITEVFWITTPDKSEMLYISPAYEVIFGRTRESLYARPLSFIEAIHPDDAERVRAALPKQPHGMFDVEYRVIRPDGALCWVRSRAFPVLDEQGQVYRIVGLAQDITERREAAEQLRERDELHRTLLDSHLDGVTLYNGERLIYANPAICELTGRSVEELMAMNPFELIAPEDQPRMRSRREDLLSGLPESTGEYLGIRADGARRKWEIRSRLVKFRGEAAILSIVRDVTEIRANQEQMRLLALIVGNSGDAILSTALDGTLLTWNPGAERLFGYSAAEVIGKPISVILPPERSHELAEKLECIRRGEAVRERITERLHRDGRRVPVTLTVSPIIDASGTIVGASAIFRDLTEQVKAESARRQSEAQWQSVVSTAPDLILIMDVDGTIRYINRTVPGVTPESIFGRKTYEFVREDFHELVRETLRHVWDTGEPVTCELVGLGANGDWRWYESRHGALKQDGKTIGVTVISSDITERKEAEQRMLAEDRLLREMLEQRERERQLIAHEVHDGFIQDIVGAQYCLQAMLHHARARNTRDLDILEAIDFTLRKAVTEGRRLIRELGPLVLDDAGLVEAIRVHLQDEVEDGRLSAHLEATCDDEHLSPLFKGTVFRIVQESLTNVRRHSRAKRVTVSLTEEGDKLIVEVRDDGVGFDTGKVHPSRYGLVGIRQRARLFGGQAVITSEIGNGTTVRVELPIAHQRTVVEDAE